VDLISSGKALEKFGEMVEMQGGDPRAIEDVRRLPQARQTTEILSPSAGYLASVQCEQIGTACVILGGGRERKEDAVDAAVGIVLHKKVGEGVDAGESLATIHYNSETRAAGAKRLLEKSFGVAEAPPQEKRPLIHRVIGGKFGNSGEKN
jgi:pyrimidine-nucleoside phosphorylase